ncbi:MAG: hypothetical protein WBC65_12600, partial [Ignavibacteria bacterium]
TCPEPVEGRGAPRLPVESLSSLYSAGLPAHWPLKCQNASWQYAFRNSPARGRAGASLRKTNEEVPSVFICILSG